MGKGKEVLTQAVTNFHVARSVGGIEVKLEAE